MPAYDLNDLTYHPLNFYPFGISDKYNIVISFLHFLKSTPRSMEKLNRKFEADLIIFKEQVQSQNSLQDLLDTYKVIT